MNNTKPARKEKHEQEQFCRSIYPRHTAAERAVKELQQSGFDMKKLSIVGRDTHTDEHVVGLPTIWRG